MMCKRNVITEFQIWWSYCCFYARSETNSVFEGLHLNNWSLIRLHQGSENKTLACFKKVRISLLMMIGLQEYFNTLLLSPLILLYSHSQ